MKDLKKLYWITGIFVVMYFLPLGNPKVSNAIFEAFKLLQWYIINHTLACVVPAMGLTLSDASPDVKAPAGAMDGARADQPRTWPWPNPSHL